ncbi:hypothetical protein ASD24_24250 [Paenibacillus sp. Root52]|uniref:hypothetical protein n=1 Tax=Paenibacillus sp. Root52 TaxID=1736552 RepID=UPI0006F3E86A|nr:hypothetical protein [Paenibacillus sp. Root52]KQY90913.1 hypothetical protein ASD24_24250 [Paenibacillus sp. Root52]
MSTVELELEIDGLQRELAGIEQRIYEKMLPKINAKRNAARQEFEKFFTDFGLTVQHTSGQIHYDGKNYSEDIVTATKGGVKYELRMPDLCVDYVGAYTVLTLSQGTKSEFKVGIKSTMKRFRSLTYGAANNSEVEKLRVNVKILKEHIEEVKKRESNLDNTSAIYTTKNLESEYESFTDILKEFTK